MKHGPAQQQGELQSPALTAQPLPATVSQFCTYTKGSVFRPCLTAMWAAISLLQQLSLCLATTYSHLEAGGRGESSAQVGGEGGVETADLLAKHEGCLSGAVSPDALLMQM